MPRMTLDQVFTDDAKSDNPMLDKPECANEIAFKWLSLYSQHPAFCKRVLARIVSQEPRSGLSKDYGVRYATEDELAKVACTGGLDDVLKALCQAATA